MCVVGGGRWGEGETDFSLHHALDRVRLDAKEDLEVAS